MNKNTMAYDEFIRGIMDETTMSRADAEANWKWFSKNMHDAMREADERGGYASGRECGADIIICM